MRRIADLKTHIGKEWLQYVHNRENWGEANVQKLMFEVV